MTMKTKLLPLFVILLLAALACNKSKSNEDPSPDTSFFFKCKIDGVDFSAEVEPSLSPGAQFTKKGEIYTITGKNKNAEGFTIALEGPLAEGTFVTDNTNTNPKTLIIYELLNPFQNWSTTEEGGSGTITITKIHSNYVEGTFSFTGKNAADGSIKEFSAGSFSARKF